MDERNRATITLLGNTLGNIAAIAAGVALFEQKANGFIFAFVALVCAIIIIRRLR